MSDIVEKLRWRVENTYGSPTATTSMLCAEASAEITRLRNELHIAQEWSARVIAGQEEDANQITALRAENEKLREALCDAAEQMEWLAENDPHCMGWVGPPWPSTTPAIKVAAEKARAALEEKR